MSGVLKKTLLVMALLLGLVIVVFPLFGLRQPAAWRIASATSAKRAFIDLVEKIRGPQPPSPLALKLIERFEASHDLMKSI